MIKYAIELETIGASIEKLQALLHLFSSEFIEVTNAEAKYNIEKRFDLMTGAYNAILELAVKYANDVNALAERYHAEAKEARK